MTPEGKVKNEVKKVLKRLLIIPAADVPKYIDQDMLFHGWYFMPTQGLYSVKGPPDFVGCYFSGFFGIETKAPGGRTTPNQDYQIAGIRIAGGRVLVTSDASEVEPFISAMAEGVPA